MTSPSHSWRVLGGSVRGQSHVIRGRPNQDALRLHQAVQGALPIAVAVADGHGDALYFRSEIGARLAVDAACETLHRAPPGSLEAQGPAIAAAMVDAWRAKVRAHLASAPFEPNEVFNALKATRTEPVDFADEPLVAYGATVLALLIRPEGMLQLQLGDGDMLLVDAQGLAARVFPPAPPEFGDATLSLCLEEAETLVQTRWLDFNADPPLLVCLCTDGYAKSFHTDGDFLKVADDYLTLLQRHGVEAVARDIPGILQRTTESGSGDDVTLAMAHRI